MNALDLEDLTNEQVIEYWNKLPEEIQLKAAMYGTSDTEVRDDIYDWFVKNLKEKPAPKISPVVNYEYSYLKTIEDAITFFYPPFKEIEDVILEHTEDSFSAFSQSGLSNFIGSQIRNILRLWDESAPIQQIFVNQHKITHPDEMSDFIVRTIYNMIRIEHNIKPE
jgi:hypothetical protein